MSAIQTTDLLSLRESLRHMAGDSLVGKALRALSGTVKGSRQYATLAMSGSPADGETFTLSNLVFELITVNTDTTANSPATATGLNVNSGAACSQTITAHGLVEGDILRCETEYLTVKGVPDANTVILNRAQFGSSFAAHNNQDVFKVASGRTGGTKPALLGRYAIPTAGTYTNTTMDDLIVTACTAHFTALKSQYKAILSASAGSVQFTRPYVKGSATNSEAMANTTITNFGGGEDDGALTRVLVAHVVTAAEVTASAALLFLDATPVAARVTFLDASTGAVDTTSTVTSCAVSGTRVTVTEGTTQWVAGDILLVEAFFA